MKSETQFFQLNDSEHIARGIQTPEQARRAKIAGMFEETTYFLGTNHTNRVRMEALLAVTDAAQSATEER